MDIFSRIKIWLLRLNQYPNDTKRKGEETARALGVLLEKINNGDVDSSKVLETVTELTKYTDVYLEKISKIKDLPIVFSTVVGMTERPVVIEWKNHDLQSGEESLSYPQYMEQYSALIRFFAKNAPERIFKPRYIATVVLPKSMEYFMLSPKPGEQIVELFQAMSMFLHRMSGLSAYDAYTWYNQYRDMLVSWIPYYLMVEDILSAHREDKTSVIVV